MSMSAMALDCALAVNYDASEMNLLSNYVPVLLINDVDRCGRFRRIVYNCVESFERTVGGWLLATQSVASRVVWKNEVAHSSGWLTTNRSPCRATTGGTRRGAGYQEAGRREEG